ncbi:MAG: prepilin peptidase [Planctomycetes bacterium]|nr:prepilin peptidase [Planctomycetota bacterium]NOG54121.1 prepilin peptidase [Planctomycetota bacterium]
MPWWQYLLVYLPFVFAFGAIVGSFLNVVILRMPAGENLVRPASHCPKCQRRLKWNENLPIVGWIWLRGKCRGCGCHISMQYPLVEAVMGLLFVSFFALCYLVRPTAPYIHDLVPAWWSMYGVDKTWPWMFLYLCMFSSLAAMTVIDARTFMIPIQLTWAVTIPAFVVHAIAPLWPAGTFASRLGSSAVLQNWVLPLVGPAGFGAGLGGLIGVFVGVALLRFGNLRHSFLDFAHFVGEDDDITSYPRPRRELEWEFDFLGFALAGVMLGWWIGHQWAVGSGGSQHTLPVWLGALGGSMVGYLCGGALIWGIRLLGTLAFGKEAMGLGDAHLLACVGAVVGWIDPILIFLIAPFLAIAWMLVTSVMGRLFGGFTQVLPYGPWLALSTMVVILGDRWLEPLLSRLLRMPIDLP